MHNFPMLFAPSIDVPGSSLEVRTDDKNFSILRTVLDVRRSIVLDWMDNSSVEEDANEDANLSRVGMGLYGLEQ